MLTIRREAPEDIDAIRHVNEQAFGRATEADLVDQLRSRGVLTISLPPRMARLSGILPSAR